jgi:hypothetical protein
MQARAVGRARVFSEATLTKVVRRSVRSGSAAERISNGVLVQGWRMHGLQTSRW